MLKLIALVVYEVFKNNNLVTAAAAADIDHSIKRKRIRVWLGK